jgi:ketosteroid isomerase-like protein
MKYPKIFILCGLLAAGPLFSFGQGVALLQQEIDQQVWKPFAATYSQFDAKGFNALHSDDVIRSGPNFILVGEEYKAQNRTSFRKVKARGEKRTISFTMESRQTREDLSYEIGYYKVTMQRKKETPRHYYGRFHAVIKKIDGHWKIAQDWDAGVIMGKEVTEEVFRTGTPLKL